jgi:membrane protein implicated in regulation of membrane protease activity
MKMSPAGLPGFFAVIVMFLGMWTLFGVSFLAALALMSIIALVSALLIRYCRARHPSGKSLLHLNSEPGDRNGTDV